MKKYIIVFFVLLSVVIYIKKYSNKVVVYDKVKNSVVKKAGSQKKLRRNINNSNKIKIEKLEQEKQLEQDKQEQIAEENIISEKLRSFKSVFYGLENPNSNAGKEVRKLLNEMLNNPNETFELIKNDISNFKEEKHKQYFLQFVERLKIDDEKKLDLLEQEILLKISNNDFNITQKIYTVSIAFETYARISDNKEKIKKLYEQIINISQNDAVNKLIANTVRQYAK